MRVLTCDVFLGAFLMAQGAHWVDLLVDKSGGRSTGTFVFEGDQNILAHQELYSMGRAIAPVKEIREGVSFLRGRLAKALREPKSDRVVSVRAKAFDPQL